MINTVLFYFLILAFLVRMPRADPYADKFAYHISAAIGALFFGIHPLRVESVAWITERRDVVSGFFYILTILAYLRMQNRENDSRDRRCWFLISFVFFGFALLSKTIVMTLPAVLLILDIYPLRRLSSDEGLISSLKKLLIEKIPFVFLSCCCVGMTALNKKNAMALSFRPLALHSIGDRFMQASYGLCFYVFKTIVPIGLSPLYLLEQPLNATELKYILCALVIISITLLLILMRHRWPWALCAWLCYIIMILPVLGFTQAGWQIAADRYTYLACLPFAILVAGGLNKLSLRLKEKHTRPLVSLIVIILVFAPMLTLSILTFNQTKIWHDEYSLWNHAIKLDPTNFIASNNLGRILLKQGQIEESIKYFSLAIQSKSDYVKAHNNLGVALMRQENFKEAISHYTEALRINPNYANAYYNLGVALSAQGKIKEAVDYYKKAIEIKPEYAKAHNELGVALAKLGNLKEAINHFSEAIKINPAFSKAKNNLRAALELINK